MSTAPVESIKTDASTGTTVTRFTDGGSVTTADTGEVVESTLGGTVTNTGTPVVSAVRTSTSNGAPVANTSAVKGQTLRTGAAGALGIKHLARKDARRLLVCGCGHQSSFQVAAALAACPQIGYVQMWDPASAEAPVARVAQVAREAKALLAGHSGR